MKNICLIVLAPDFMTNICKKAAQHFHNREIRSSMVRKYKKQQQGPKERGAYCFTAVRPFITLSMHSGGVHVHRILIFIKYSQNDR
jgi:hypothetical protein